MFYEVGQLRDFYTLRRRGALSDTAIRPSVCPMAQLP